MKKQAKASTALVMWVMIIVVHAHLSTTIAAAAEEINGSTTHYSVCGGSVQACLTANDLDSEFPDAISSHFRRVLGQVKSKTQGSFNPQSPAFRVGKGQNYRGSSPRNPNVARGVNCASQYKRIC